MSIMRRPWLFWSVLCFASISAAQPAKAEQKTSLSLQDALNAALFSNWGVRIKSIAVERSGGALQQAIGAFDTNLSLNLSRTSDRRLLNDAEKPLLPGQSENFGRGLSARATLSRLLPSGLSVSSSVTTSQNTDNLSSLSGMSSATNRSMAVTLTVPLARGSGSNFASASLAASKKDLEASHAELRLAVSETLRDVAVAYWDYLSTYRQAEIARLGEKRTGETVREISKLIAADEIPAADLGLAIATHAERTNARLVAEQALLEARLGLTGLMGVEFDKVTDLADPGERFPVASSVPAVKLDDLVSKVLERRSDWQSQKLQVEALRERFRAYSDLARPQVDMGLSVSSAGLGEHESMSQVLIPFGGRFAGPSVAASISTQFPWKNDVALGQLRQMKAELETAEIRLRSLHADIAARLSSAVAEVRRSVTSLQGSSEVVNLYAKSLSNEQIKRRLGMSTLIDVINVEDRYFRALIDEVTRQRDYAVSLARLGHEVDSLVRKSGDRFELSLDDFLQLSAIP